MRGMIQLRFTAELYLIDSNRFKKGKVFPVGVRLPIQFGEIKKATGNFQCDHLSDQLGFSGWLHEDTLFAANRGTGMKVAVKVLRPRGTIEHTELLVSFSHSLFPCT